MGGREKEWLERSWVRNKGNLREAVMGVGWVSIPALFFCMDMALAAADRGCCASRPSGTVSTGSMTCHGLPSLFSKVTHSSWQHGLSWQEEHSLQRQDTLKELSFVSLANA